MSMIFKFSPEKAKQWCDEDNLPYDVVTKPVVFSETGKGALTGDAILFIYKALLAYEGGEDCGDGLEIDFGRQCELHHKDP